jgi:hypothetical protein
LRSDPSLIQAEKMASLGQLTAGIAHEIKNPLNFVNNFADLSVELLDELKETAAPAIAALSQDKRTEIDETIGMLTGNLDKIAEHGRRADGIVKSMLEHSRGSSGERWSVDLIDLIEDQRSSADLEILVSDCFSSRPSSWTIDVARRKTPPPGTAPGSERILASMLERYSGSCCASEDSSCTTTAANPSMARNAISTVRVTAATLPICNRRSQRTAGANRKLNRTASAIGTMTSRAKYRNATTSPVVRTVSTPKSPEGI